MRNYPRLAGPPYLAWHADGRRDPPTPIALVLLFLCGLQRRGMSDVWTEPTALADIPPTAG